MDASAEMVASPASPATTRRCGRCGRSLAGRRADARYCGPGCRGVASRERAEAREGVASAPDQTRTARCRPPAPSPPAPRCCEHAPCGAELAPTARPDARYCSPTCKAAAHRVRREQREREALAQREHTRAVRRAAAARRRAARQAAEAEVERRREAERAELARLRSEVARLRRCTEAAARALHDQ